VLEHTGRACWEKLKLEACALHIRENAVDGLSWHGALALVQPHKPLGNTAATISAAAVTAASAGTARRIEISMSGDL
jgi:hypothetical protein